MFSNQFLFQNYTRGRGMIRMCTLWRGQFSTQQSWQSQSSTEKSRELKVCFFVEALKTNEATISRASGRSA
jgi:hypothetical protein